MFCIQQISRRKTGNHGELGVGKQASSVFISGSIMLAGRDSGFDGGKCVRAGR